MASAERPKRLSARERLLAAADELFYRDGVHSTGIDAIIAKAGVAKGSLYYNFGGKDDLIAAYLRGRHQGLRQRVEELQAAAVSPDDKVLAPFDAIAEFVSHPTYRGCPFVNAAAENTSGVAQNEATNEYREWLRQWFFDRVQEAGVAEPAAILDALVVLYDGAMATASMDDAAIATAVAAKRIARLTLAVARASAPI